MTDFSMTRASVSLEDQFARPEFAVATDRLAILEAIVSAASPDYAIPARNVRAGLNVASLAEVVLSVRAFDGAGQFEITPEKSTLTFSGLEQEDDFAAIERFSALVDGALREFIPLDRVQTRIVQQHLYFSTKDPEFDEPEFLRSLVNKKLHQLGKSDHSADFAIEMKLVNSEATRATRLLFERSARDDANLFVSYANAFTKEVPSLKGALSESRLSMHESLSELGIEVG